jgi:hypothetical protein
MIGRLKQNERLTDMTPGMLLDVSVSQNIKKKKLNNTTDCKEVSSLDCQVANVI